MIFLMFSAFGGIRGCRTSRGSLVSGFRSFDFRFRLVGRVFVGRSDARGSALVALFDRTEFENRFFGLFDRAQVENRFFGLFAARTFYSCCWFFDLLFCRRFFGLFGGAVGQFFGLFWSSDFTWRFVRLFAAFSNEILWKKITK